MTSIDVVYDDLEQAVTSAIGAGPCAGVDQVATDAREQLRARELDLDNQLQLDAVAATLHALSSGVGRAALVAAVVAADRLGRTGAYLGGEL